MTAFNTIALLAAEPHSAPVTHWGPRIAFTFITVAVIALAVWGMRRSWIKKARHFAHLPAPIAQAPEGTQWVVGPVEARFAGTTTTGQWLNRVVTHNLGTPRGVTVAVSPDGLWLTDDTDFNLWLPAHDIVAVRTGRGIAGDVVEPDGMIIVSWTLGDTTLDSGIRVTRNADHEQVLGELTQLVTQLEETA
jgi:hypothetical protein